MMTGEREREEGGGRGGREGDRGGHVRAYVWVHKQANVRSPFGDEQAL